MTRFTVTNVTTDYLDTDALRRAANNYGIVAEVVASSANGELVVNASSDSYEPLVRFMVVCGIEESDALREVLNQLV
jgi:hypothetical protein